MADPRHDARFVEEHRDELGAAREMRMHPLDRHGAAEAPCPAHATDMDGRHAAAGDLVEHLATPDHGRSVDRIFAQVHHHPAHTAPSPYS
jgi:hypothetical protein